MKTILKTLIILFTSVSHSQQNMDTIYGNPKYVREKVEFLNVGKQNYKFLTDNDYGHAMIFTPKNVKNSFKNHWYERQSCFYINYEKYFLKNGMPKNEIWYNKDGSFERKYQYTFDKNNNLIEKKDFYNDNEFRLNKYHYNIDNRLIATSKYYNNEPNEFRHSYYIRDINNNLIESKRYNEEGERNSIIYELDSLGKIKEEYRKEAFHWFSEKNGEKAKKDSLSPKKLIREHEFDNKGNKVISFFYNEETNKISGKAIFKYDDNNNLIYQGSVRDSLYAYNRYNYNDNSFLTKSEYVNIASPDSNKIINYWYNSEGYIIKVVYIEYEYYTAKEKKFIINYKYKFDKKKNWTEITKIVNDEPLYVWSRKIKYY